MFFCSSCAYHYRNNLSSFETDSISIYDIQNLTSEASLTALLKNALGERISQSPGLKLAKVNDENSDRLVLTLKKLDNRTVARARLREKKSRDYEGDAYQSVLYRINASLSYELYQPSNKSKAFRKGTVKGQADLPRIHDREVALKTALKQLAIDLSENLLNELSER